LTTICAAFGRVWACMTQRTYEVQIRLQCQCMRSQRAQSQIEAILSIETNYKRSCPTPALAMQTLPLVCRCQLVLPPLALLLSPHRFALLRLLRIGNLLSLFPFPRHCIRYFLRCSRSSWPDCSRRKWHMRSGSWISCSCVI